MEGLLKGASHHHNLQYNSHRRLLQLVPMYLQTILQIHLNKYVLPLLISAAYPDTCVYFSWSLPRIYHISESSTGPLPRVYHVRT